MVAPWWTLDTLVIYSMYYNIASRLIQYTLSSSKCVACGQEVWLAREGSFVTYHGRGSQCLGHSVTLPSTIHDSSSPSHTAFLSLPTPLQA